MRRKLVRENNKIQTKPIECLHTLYKWLADVLICIYMLLIIVVIPLHYSEGYYGIGTGKALLYVEIAKGVLVLSSVGIVLAGILWFSENRKCSTLLSSFKRLSVTQRCAFFFGVTVGLSFLFTDYTKEALLGADGWYMGCLTQLALLGSFFLIVHIWEKRLWILSILFPVSAFLFLFGYLNRFGIYPIEMPGANPQFISFVGNINWYCGYMVVVLFGAVYLAWCGCVRNIWLKALLYVYLLLGFAGLVTQGSSSGIFTLAAVLLLLFYMSVSDSERMLSFWHILLLLSVACCFTWIIRCLFPERITYREGSTELLTNTWLPLAMLFLGITTVGVLTVLQKKKKYPHKVVRCVAKILAVILVGAGVGCLLLMLGNLMFPGALGGIAQVSLFQLSPQWGSKRGATWAAGVLCFAEQGIGKKLIGVGPDCMGSYLTLDAGVSLRALLAEQFNGLRLTNAHNEWITILADYGILGVTFYVGMIGSAIVRFLKAGRKGTSTCAWVTGACGLGIFAYTLHNMFSFQQVVNITIMYLFLGVGEAFISQAYDTPKERYP